MLILQLLLIATMAASEPQIVTCTVTGPATITCPIRNPIPECQNSKHKYCRSVVITSIQWDNEAFSEWILISDHWNFPLRKATPTVGQKLKVVEGDGGQFFPVASCEVRVHRRVNQWVKNHPGERVPFTIMELPADCQGKR